MKDYIKPEVEVVSFATEKIMGITGPASDQVDDI